MSRLHQRIQERKKSEAPITYSNLSINKMGKLEDRTKKLDQRVISGYGVIWGSVNDYGERFVKGCFAKSIKEHGPGSTHPYQLKFRDRHGKSCSLFAELKEDDIGLYFETKPLDDVSWANDLLTQVRSGTINNFSIGFRHMWDRVEWDDEEDCMVNLEARLFEISAVDIPSDLETYATRSAEDYETLSYEVEDFITSLPRPFQLEARTIFTRCLSPNIIAPEIENRSSPKEVTPTKKKKSIDYDFLTNKIKQQ